MLISCKCLNVCATILENEPDLTTRTFDLHQELAANNSKDNNLRFLKEAFGPFTNPANLKIQIRHEELTGKRHAQASCKSSWLMTQCLECDQIVYATKLNNSKTIDEAPTEVAVIFNRNLLTNVETINAWKLDDHYSKIYKILVRHPTTLMMMSTSSSPPKVDQAQVEAHSLLNPHPHTRGLALQLQERLRKETEETEERIRRFTESEFSALKLFRQTAEGEFQHLAQKVLREQAVASAGGSVSSDLSESTDRKLISISILSGGNLLTPPLTPDSGTVTPMTIGNSPPHLKAVPPMLNSGIRLKSREKMMKMRRRNDYDDDEDLGMDGFFPSNVDVINDQQQQMSDFEEDFDEDAEDDFCENLNPVVGGKNIPGRSGHYGRQISGGGILAKSLPIPTPALPDHRFTDEEVEERLDANVDIAASISKLAKSVHGDAVFGELPRPRFSSQI